MLIKPKRPVPEPIFNFTRPFYHFILAFLGSVIYRFPSRKLYVIGVTGTKGKTTVSNLIHHILNSSGMKTGLATTVNFKIGVREWPNKYKQTMLGRFKLQKLLRQMVNEGCKYAVIETSSEGILQYRHKFIDYNAAVFLNLFPEHLERHGGFENYRAAKVKLFEKLACKKDGVGIYNLDDENVSYFLKPKVNKKIGYSLNPKSSTGDSHLNYKLQITNYKLNSNGSEFIANNINYKINLIGEFNVYNAAAAICAALSQNISVEKIQKSLANFKPVSGRMEIMYAKALTNRHMRIKEDGGDFTIVIDYAHEPKGLEEVYKAVSDSKLKAQSSKLICILGSAGGGRDKWKRPAMGKIAAKYCDEIILTNEDPYDENPTLILTEIESGFSQMANRKWQTGKNYWKIINRKEAIKKAISLAQKGDVVVLTGKGGEMWMCVENNKKIPWDEKKIVEEILAG
ncbi:UDP-N-acetylmuramyl-tripeptide synthetase [Candidatus Wolfebacteria bacterium]|nr:UDP-N-acetylmuramyl-tripeptide synthetase [Candidatus Wolfebacteria bacterium]